MNDAPTHRLTVTLSSIGDGTNVEIELEFDPGLDDLDPRDLGYRPAALKAFDEYILPAIEKMASEATYAYIENDEPDSGVRH